jgi:hypothetical protein
VPLPNCHSHNWTRGGTTIPADVGRKIVELLLPYCEAAHGEASLGAVIPLPDGAYFHFGTTDDDVGSGYAWTLLATPKPPPSPFPSGVRYG